MLELRPGTLKCLPPIRWMRAGYHRVFSVISVCPVVSVIMVRTDVHYGAMIVSFGK